MIFSINDGYSKFGTVEERMDAAKQVGFSCFNINSGTCNDLLLESPAETKTFKSLLRQRELAVDWLHAPFYQPTLYVADSEKRAVSMGAIKTSITIASELEAETIIVHTHDPDFPKDFMNDDTFKRLSSAFSALVDFAQPYGVKVAIENLEEPYSQELLDKLLAEINGLAFCFDIGHAFLGKTMDYYLPKYIDRLSALHIHDNHGEKDEHLIPGQGLIDFNSFFRMLKAYDYKGYVGIECHAEDEEGADAPLPAAANSWEQVNKLLMDAIQ